MNDNDPLDLIDRAPSRGTITDLLWALLVLVLVLIALPDLMRWMS